MFDLSFGKLAIIFALCLIVLGPEKLPKLAAQLGRFAGQARAMARHFRSQLEQEIAADQLKKEFRAADEAINKIATQTSSPISAVTAVIDEALMRDTSPEAMHANDPPPQHDSQNELQNDPLNEQAGVDPNFNLNFPTTPVQAADSQQPNTAEQPVTASVEKPATHTAA